MTADEARALLHRQSRVDIGRFYGSTRGLALGVGLFYESIRLPIFDPTDRLYTTIEGPVYVLTHECDVDQDNDRILNEQVVICPVLTLQAFLEEYEGEFHDEGALSSFLAEVGQRSVSRLLYLPPGPSFLNGGAFISLNSIASTHISEFEKREPTAALTEYGLREVDVALTNHFTRPKADEVSQSWLKPMLGLDH